MSDKESLIKLQELTSAALGLEQELEEARAAHLMAATQVEAISANIAEVKTAIAGIGAGLGK